MVFCSVSMLFSDSNFGRFGPFEMGVEEPDIRDFNTMSMEMMANFILRIRW